MAETLFECDLERLEFRVAAEAKPGQRGERRRIGLAADEIAARSGGAEDSGVSFISLQ